MSKFKLQTLATLHAHCVREGKCWIWQNVKDRPKVTHNGKVVTARRLARELADGHPVPAGMQVIARCGKPKCIAPGCSYIGTIQTRCKAAAAHGSYDLPNVRLKQAKARNDRSHITDEIVLAVRLAEGSLQAIADRFGISKPYAHQLRNNKARVGYRTPFTGLGARP